MIVRNSQSYRLLTLVAMSGECSKEAMELLMPQDSYRKKLMMQLTGDNLIKVYEKNAVKGYRLSRRGKILLLQMDGERFGFFLEEGADATMRRSKLPQRERQHRISEVLAMMESSGAEIYWDRKEHIFEDPDGQIVVISQSAFYLPKEVKSQMDLSRKIINSKLAGVWLTESAVWVCYNMGPRLINWYENVEVRADILIRSILKKKGMNFHGSCAVLFGENMVQAKLCLEDPMTRAYFANSSFERICFVPLDEQGKALLQIIGDADMYEHLREGLMEDLVQERIGTIACDGVSPDGRYVLICTDMDLKRLIQFNTRMQYSNGRGEVYCFGFQKNVIGDFCSENIEVVEVDFEMVREVFGLNKK
ncbi:hypothetical protein [Anaerotignum sp.]